MCNYFHTHFEKFREICFWSYFAKFKYLTVVVEWALLSSYLGAILTFNFSLALLNERNKILSAMTYMT